MSETIAWLPDGTPYSTRFDDRYHGEQGLAQARDVFLHGCGLPAAWAGAQQWRILETGFGFGLNFLATWAAWRADPARPRLLHFVSLEAWPVSADDLLRAAQRHPELADLAQELHAQYWGLLPGIHRLWLDDGHVLLTLCIGDAQALLRQQLWEVDAVYLDGFNPQRNPAIWSPETLKAMARHCRRGTRLATWTVARSVRDALTQCGFQVEMVPGLPPKRDNLRACYDPHWQPRSSRQAPEFTQPARCLVLGAGLAGATAAASLARRGWQVTLLDAFRAANEVLQGAVQGIAELITRPGLINVDFADVRTVMGEMGMAMMGSGTATGPDRAREAAEAAISSPLLEEVNLSGARGILVNVTAGMDLALGEFHQVGETVKQCASDDATVVVGTVIDPEMSDSIRVTVVATGLGRPETVRQPEVTPMRVVSRAPVMPAAAAAPEPVQQNYGVYEQPPLRRRAVNESPVAAGPVAEANFDMLDIPAFLRRQAD